MQSWEAVCCILASEVWIEYRLPALLCAILKHFVFILWASRKTCKNDCYCFGSVWPPPTGSASALGSYSPIHIKMERKFNGQKRNSWRNLWNMLNKRKKTCYTSLGFIIQRIQSTQPLTRACVYSHLTLVGWPIPLDYHCSFPFFEIGDSHLSPAGRFRHGGSSGFGLMGQHLIFRIRKLLLDANTTWAAGCAACLHLCLCKKNKKGAACFLVEANRMQMLGVWEEGMWKEEAQADEGVGG